MKTVFNNVEKPAYNINKTLKNHANDPFVKKKIKKAIAILSSLKNPLPTE